MFHNRKSNNKVNLLHERAPRMIYNDFRWMLPKCISVLIDPVLRCGFQVLFFDNCIIFIFYCKYTFLRRINKEIIKINNHHKQDSKITRSKISYNLIEPQPLPCTTACDYEFHALAVHPLPTFTSHSSSRFCWVPLGSL